MDTLNIKIIEKFGPYVSGRKAAAELRQEALDAVVSGVSVVEIDFEGVEVLSHSFSDGLLAVLVAYKGRDWFKRHIRVLNLIERERERTLAVIAERLASLEAAQACSAA